MRTILVSSGLVPTTKDTLLDARTRVATFSEIANIENPARFMVITVEDTGKKYEVRKLSSKIIGGIVVENSTIDINDPEALVDLGLAEELRSEEEKVRQSNEKKRIEAENLRKSAEDSRNVNETNRVSAEGAREASERTRVSSEETRNANEQTRNSNETKRQSQESTRQSQESARQANESTRNTNESARKEAESGRKTEETSRRTAELSRSSAENTRAKNEQNRTTAENTRSSAEDRRVANETQRTANETARSNAELSREKAEGNRASTFETLKGRMQTTIQEGQTAVAATEKATIDARKVVNEYDTKVSEQDSKLSELGSEAIGIPFELGSVSSSGALSQSNTRARSLPIQINQTGIVRLIYNIPSGFNFVKFSSGKYAAWAYDGETAVKFVPEFSIFDDYIEFASDGTFDNIRIAIKKENEEVINPEELSKASICNNRLSDFSTKTFIILDSLKKNLSEIYTNYEILSVGMKGDGTIVGNGLSVLIPVNTGDILTISGSNINSNSKNAYFGILQDNINLTEGSLPNYSSEYIGRQQVIGGAKSFVIPSDSNFILVTFISSGSNYTPTVLEINGINMYSSVFDGIFGTGRKLNELYIKDDSKSKGIFNNAELNDLIKELYFPNVNYREVHKVLVRVAYYVSSSSKYYNSIYMYGDGVTLGSIEYSFDSEEEAIAAWNNNTMISIKGNKGLIVNKVEAATSIEITEIKLNHPLTLEFAPYIKAYLFENDTNNALADKEDKILELEKNVEHISFSDNPYFNTYIEEIYADIDSSVVTRFILSIAYLIGDKYYNSLVLRTDSDLVIDISQYYDTQEEALVAWNNGIKTSGGFVRTRNCELKPFRTSSDNIRIYRQILPYYGEKALQKTEELENTITLLEGNTTRIVKSINLFNKNTAKNGYLTGSRIIEDSGYRYSSPIRVKGGIIYKGTSSPSLGGNTTYHIVDSNGGFIKAKSAEKDDNGFLHYAIEEDCYISINIGTNKNLETAMFTKEELFPSEYIPYGDELPDSKIFDYNIIKTLDVKDDILKGKILSVNGDSICAGAGFKGGYGKIIAERNGMTFQNIGVGGGTIAAETYVSGNARHWICRTISDMREDADFALLEGGVNDPGNNVQLGELSSGYSAELDDTTFYGAFESMLKQLIIRFKGKKIGYIAVHKMTSTYSSTKKNGASNCYHAAKECCEKWGVPFLDLNIEVPAFGFFPNDESELGVVRNTYTYNGDGWHPNEEGYKQYYCDKIEAWMKTL